MTPGASTRRTGQMKASGLDKNSLVERCVSEIVCKVTIRSLVTQQLKNTTVESDGMIAAAAELTLTSSSFPLRAATCRAVFPCVFDHSKMNGYRS